MLSHPWHLESSTVGMTILRCIRLILFWNCKYKNVYFLKLHHQNFDAIRKQRRISASFPVKMLLIYLPKFVSIEKSGSYSVYSYSRIASIERVLTVTFRLRQLTIAIYWIEAPTEGAPKIYLCRLQNPDLET